MIYQNWQSNVFKASADDSNSSSSSSESSSDSSSDSDDDEDSSASSSSSSSEEDNENMSNNDISQIIDACVTGMIHTIKKLNLKDFFRLGNLYCKIDPKL